MLAFGTTVACFDWLQTSETQKAAQQFFTEVLDSTLGSCWGSVLQHSLPWLCRGIVGCASRASSVVQVPRSLYSFSSAAFASAACINACAVFYEDSPFKRQSALIQVVIKGLAAAVDIQMAYGTPLLIINPLNQP